MEWGTTYAVKIQVVEVLQNFNVDFSKYIENTCQNQ